MMVEKHEDVMTGKIAPEKKQNGSLWGGEFSAKIFLKHWYLQCFPAMKALKPLF